MRLISGAIALLLILSLLPPRWGRWVSVFGDLAGFIVAPVKQPVYHVATWLLPARKDAAKAEEAQHYMQERDHFRTLYLQERQRAEALDRRIAEMSSSEALSDQRVRQLPASVIGGSGTGTDGVLEIKAGSGRGVEVNAVATVNGVQLVGRVERVSPLSCWVSLITDRSYYKSIGAAVMLPGDTRLGCQLIPQRDGTLMGQVKYEPDPSTPGAALLPAVGQEVRLDDAAQWPRSAQMLLIGMVEKVEPAPSMPTRQIVTVRPTADLGRISEVTLRLTEAPQAPGGTP